MNLAIDAVIAFARWEFSKRLVAPNRLTLVFLKSDRTVDAAADISVLMAWHLRRWLLRLVVFPKYFKSHLHCLQTATDLSIFPFFVFVALHGVAFMRMTTHLCALDYADATNLFYIFFF